MKVKDKQLFHSQTLVQLQTDLAEAQKNLVDLRLKLRTNQLKNTSQLKKTRHQIAVLKTIIEQKQITAKEK
jgi:large subunit ribosomal protein L29